MRLPIHPWGAAALAVVMIGLPTVFFAAKAIPKPTSGTTTNTAPAPVSNPATRNTITKRLGTCATKTNAADQRACYTRERQACESEAGEKTWCIQRALTGKLAATAASCPASRTATERRRCLGRLWGADAVDDRRAITNADRQEVCQRLATQRDRDRCLFLAVRQLVRDESNDHSICAVIQDAGVRADCVSQQLEE